MVLRVDFPVAFRDLHDVAAWPIFFAILPEADETVERLGDFIRQHTTT